MLSTKAVGMSLLHHAVRQDPFAELSRFQGEFYSCLTRRADALFELAGAVLCADGPVRSLVELSLVGEHRRGHGGLYDALAAGQSDVARLRRALAAVSLPRSADGRLVLAADITCWPRPGAHTSPQRILGWTCPKIRTPRSRRPLDPADPCRLRPAPAPPRPAADLRRPWEKPVPLGRLTPARVRRGFRHLRPKAACPTGAPKSARPGPGRPPGRRNNQPTARYDVHTVRKPDPTK